MNWSKRQIQMYGVFLAFLGFLLGVSVTHNFHEPWKMNEILPFIFVVIPFNIMTLGLAAILIKFFYKLIKDN